MSRENDKESKKNSWMVLKVYLKYYYFFIYISNNRLKVYSKLL